MLYWSQRGCRQQQCNNETVKSVEFNLIADHFIKMAGQSYHNKAISGISDTTLPKKEQVDKSPFVFLAIFDSIVCLRSNGFLAQIWAQQNPKMTFHEKYLQLLQYISPVLNNQPERKHHWLPLLKRMTLLFLYCSCYILWKQTAKNPWKEAFCPKRKVFARELTYPLPTVHKGLPRHDAENKHIQIYIYMYYIDFIYK